MTTALFGGAFDPPTNGHVALARAARARFDPDRLVVLVVAAPGHKPVVLDAPGRLDLARAAFPDDEVELDGHARTLDLLREGRFDDPLFLVGADEFAGFLAWKEPNAVLELARLGVATRPGFPRDTFDGVLSALERPDRVELFEIPKVPISSTEVRDRVARGEAYDELVPSPVAALIRRRGYYRRAGYTGAVRSTED